MALFPENTKNTYLNASTLSHARICWEEIDPENFYLERTLCRSAAQHGNVWTLQYLRAVQYVDGVVEHVRKQHDMVIYMYYSGVEKWVVHGVPKLALVPP